MSTTVNGSTEGFTWDEAEGLPLLLQDGSTRYVTGLGGLPLEQISGDGSVLYYHQDQLGSTRLLTDPSGAVQGQYAHDPFGTVLSHTGVSTPFQYAGQYTDGESGLQYLRARYYDPSTMQFLTVDPLVGFTGEPYSYTANDPLNGTDPGGLDPCAGTANELLAAICPGSAGASFGQGVSAPEEGGLGATGAEDVSGLAPGEALTGAAGAVPTSEEFDRMPGSLSRELEQESGEQETCPAVEFGGRISSTTVRRRLTRLVGAPQPDDEAHHVFPVKYGQRFADRGIAINEARYLAWVNRSLHRGFSAAYNDAWEDFLAGSRTRAEILQFGRLLATKYGYSVNY